MLFDKDRLKAEGRFRSLQSLDRRDYVDFSSNDSLGLSTCSHLLSLFKSLNMLQFGSSGSRLLGGDHPIFHNCETRIAADLGKPAALFFNSGFQLNTGVLPALYGSDDVIFMDKLAHASLLDGALKSSAKLIRYKHNDLTHLSALLDKHRGSFKRALLVTESLFSMDGDLSDLNQLIQLKARFQTELMVDDAHGIGSCGPHGLGFCKPYSQDIDYIVGTFGKALASSGAYIAASTHTIETLINTCRSFMYSTALPLPVMQWNCLVWDYVQDLDAERKHIQDLATRLRQALSPHYKVLGTQHIVPIIVGESKQANALSHRLFDAKIIAPAIRPPTIPEGSARLRFCIHASHTPEDIQRVIDVLS
jgi:8-amino-7-oxononanoate synthase